MRRVILCLVVIGLTLSGCASSPCIESMMPLPVECLQSCDPAPLLLDQRHVWELNVLQWGLECSRLHQDCVNELKGER